MTEPRERISERHFADYLLVLRKHQWLITGIFLVAVITVGVWTFRQIPIYQAAATILIDPEAPKILNIQEVTPMGSAPWDPNYYPTQHEIIKSRAVLNKTIQALKLKERAPALASDDVLRSSLIVEPRRNTRLVLIKVEQSDPALAAEIANAIAAAYVQYNLELKMKGASEAVSWLTEEANRLRTKDQEAAVGLQSNRGEAGTPGLERQQTL